MRARTVLLATTVVMTACASHPRIQTRILDAEGRPIPGAVLYVETATPGPEFDDAADFAWAAAAPDGNAPPLGAAPVTVALPWRGMASVAAVAPGYIPEVRHLRGVEVGGDGVGFQEIRLRRREEQKGAWGLEGLSWPTFRREGLRAQCRKPEQAALRAALATAWEEGAAGGTLSEVQRRKLDVQRSLAP